MADLTIYGFDASTYVRSARMACEEKGVSYTLEPVDLASPGYRKLHPFGKMPAARHGDFVLFETVAICRYLDRVFEGPPLQPREPRAQAVMDAWLSATLDYLYPVMVREIVIERLLVPTRGGTPNEATIAAAVPKMAAQLDALDHALAGGDYLAGEDVSLADLLVVPILTYLKSTPEGGPEMAKRANVSAWFGRMSERPSFAATLPRPSQAA